MISETLKLNLGLQPSGMYIGAAVMHGCEIMLWPTQNQQSVYVMDCDYHGRPLREGILRVFTFWDIGLKVQKEIDCTEDFLLLKDGRDHILKQILL